MPLAAKVVKVEVPSATGSQATTGVGFQPSAIIAVITKRTADGVGGNACVGMGFATGAADRWCIGAHILDAAASSDCDRASSNVAVVRVRDNSNTIVLEADLTSLDTDGFTLNWTAVVSGVDLFVLCLGGASLTNAKAGSFTKATVTGNQGVTGVGFQPDVVLFLGSRSTTPTSNSTHAYFPLGVAQSSSARWTVGEGANDAQATGDSGRRMYDANALLMPTTTGGISSLADFVSHDADGFTLNWTTASGAAEYVGYLALKGASVKVGTVTQPTSAGSQVVTGVGFRPTALLLAGANLTSLNGASATADWDLSLGMASGASERAAVWTGDNDPADPTEADTSTASDRVYVARTVGTAALAADADGFTLNWANADATARIAGYLALGPAVSSLVLPRRYERGKAYLRR